MFIKNDDDNIWRSSIPKLTFEMFNINLYDLMKQTDLWLKKHSCPEQFN